MSYTQSPNMSLIIPTVGSEAGPTYAQDINTSLTLVDSHSHIPGQGVPITPAALNINSNLTLQNNFLTNVGGLTLTAALVTPAINTIYESGVDLYFVDGNGNNVRITQSGGVAGTPGSISNLASPASAAYVAVSQKFVWQSGTGIAADMDFGSAVLRNLSPNSTYGLTLAPPASMSSNTTITLPTLPASTKIMVMDSSGTISSTYDTDNTTLEVASSLLRIKDLGVSTAKIAALAVTTAKIDNLAVGTAQIAAKAVTAAKIADNTITGAQVANDISLPGTGVSAGGHRVVVSQYNSSTLFSILPFTFPGYVGAGFSFAGVGVVYSGDANTGTLIVTFNTPFSAAPFAVISADANSGLWSVVSSTTTSITFGCTAGSGTLVPLTALLVGAV